jgi:hypothetical protein
MNHLINRKTAKTRQRRDWETTRLGGVKGKGGMVLSEESGLEWINKVGNGLDFDGINVKKQNAE